MSAAHSIPEEIVRKIEIMTYELNPHPLAVIMKDELITDTDLEYINAHDERGKKYLLDCKPCNKVGMYLKLRWKWYNSFGFRSLYKEYWGTDSEDDSEEE